MQEKRVRKSGEQKVLPTYIQVPVTACTRMTLLRDLNEMWIQFVLCLHKWFSTYSYRDTMFIKLEHYFIEMINMQGTKLNKLIQEM